MTACLLLELVFAYQKSFGSGQSERFENDELEKGKQLRMWSTFQIAFQRFKIVIDRLVQYLLFSKCSLYKADVYISMTSFTPSSLSP